MPKGKRGPRPGPKPGSTSSESSGAEAPASGSDFSEGTAGARVNDRAERIRCAVRDIMARDAEIKSLREDVNEIKNSVIKGDLSMNASDFKIAMRIYKLEGDDRDKCFDTLRECFNALSLGKQLDWLDALDGSGSAAEKEPAGAPISEAIAYDQGLKAGREGAALSSCKFDIDRQAVLRERWIQGWTDGQAEIAAGMKSGASAEASAVH